MGAALTNNNIARFDNFTTITLYTKTLGFRIATITCTTACFSLNSGNQQFSKCLPVACSFVMMFAATELDNFNLLSATL